ncbi:hypothetical protein ACHAXS_004275 [Conticribra weissflogii]
MQNTIDFRELRRQERRRLRLSNRDRKNESLHSIQPTVNSDVNNQANIPYEPSDAIATPLIPYETLLLGNHLSDETHKILSPQLNSVYYAEKFLSTSTSQDILFWLSTIPEYFPNDTISKNDNIHNLVNGKQPQLLTEREETLRHNGKWTRLKHARRNVALFDGTIPSSSSTVNELPPILQRLSITLVAIGAFPPSHPPNHVLINEYRPGEGIMPHTDGPAYESRTATISLGGSDVVFKLWPRRNTDEENESHGIGWQQQIIMSSNLRIEKRDNGLSKIASNTATNPELELILHGDGSLVVFTDDAYLDHCHEISEGILEEVTTRGVCGNDLEGGTVIKRGHRFSLTFRCKKSASN